MERIKLPTLDDFLASNMVNLIGQRSYVDEPGFDSLYVRVTKHYLDGKWLATIDIANVTATEPGKGAFTRLLQRLRSRYPHMTLFVESVQNERLMHKLLRMGFEGRVGEPGNFYLLPEKELIL